MTILLRFLYLLCFLIPQIPVFAQTKEELNRKVQEANQKLYSNPKEAIDIGLQVLHTNPDPEIEMMALVVIVNGYSFHNEIGKALEYSKQAMSIADKSNNTSHRVWALGLLGEQYQVAGQNMISRELLDQAKNLISIAEFPEESKALALGNIYAIVGNGYKDEIDCKFAIQNYDLAIDAYQPYSHNSAAKNNLALVFLEKGDCLLELNMLNEAKNYYLEAIKISKESELTEYLQRGKTGKAKVESKLGNYKISSDLALEIIQNENSKLSLTVKNDLYQTLAYNYLKENDLENFHVYDEKHNLTSQEILDIKKSKSEQVLNFIEGESLPENNTSLRFLYAFLFLLLLIGIYEFTQIKRKQSTQKTISKEEKP